MQASKVGEISSHTSALCVAAMKPKKTIHRVPLWSQQSFVIDFERPRISFAVCKVKHVCKSLQDQGLNV